MKILVVDDVGYTRHYYSRILQQEGHTTLTAESGTEALRIMQNDCGIDLVLTDLKMPDMDGVELFKRVQKIERIDDFGSVDSPEFVLMTALHPGKNALPGDVERIEMAKKIGFAAVLLKPSEREHILNILSQVELRRSKGSTVDFKFPLDQIRQSIENIENSGDMVLAAAILEKLEPELERLRVVASAPVSS